MKYYKLKIDMIKTINKNCPEVIELKRRVEEKIGQPFTGRNIYSILKHEIYDSLHENISESTLHRFWDYVKNTGETKEVTLDVLSRYIGHKNWHDFKCKLVGEDENESDSNLLNSSHSISTSELQVGDILQIAWQPNRYCKTRYCGNNQFEVLSSENAKLQPGDTFKCGLFIKGESLSLDEVRQATNPDIPQVMVIGKKLGLTVLKKTNK